MSYAFLNSFACFLFFSLALCFPSGYSYGAAIFALTAFFSFGKIKKLNLDKLTLILFFIIIVMGIAWVHTFNGLFIWTGSDQWIKYSLAALSLLAVAASGVRLPWLQWGLVAGGVGALGVAVYQYQVLGMTKATGHTNAIQYGGLAMYTGLAAWAWALLSDQSKWQRAALWAGGACAVMASLLSETRGAWVVAPFLMLCMLAWMWQSGRVKTVVGFVLGTTLMVAAMVLPYGDKFSSRANVAVVEFQHYAEDPVKGATTSIGQRLEQWRLAWAMWQDKPVMGWGTQGIVEGKQSYVDQGLAHPSVMDYGHAHNEIMDMLAKRGAVGLSLLLLFYAIPLAVFWPSKSRIARLPQALQGRALALRASASLLPLAYFGFGWTQVFFAHNSGHMFYVFAIVAFWGALQHLERRDSAL